MYAVYTIQYTHYFKIITQTFYFYILYNNFIIQNNIYKLSFFKFNFRLMLINNIHKNLGTYVLLRVDKN